MILLGMLAGCVPMAQKVGSGANSVEDRMLVNLDDAWNEISVPSSDTTTRALFDIGPAHVWTMEGLPIDRLLIYSGIKDGQVIHFESSNASLKSFRFHSGMQADQLVAMFEGMLSRDGSTFKLVKLEPSKFGGGRGIRFEYTQVRKGDSVVLSGLGYAVVDRGELFAILYSAPRLTFFPRHRLDVEKLAQSAKIYATPQPQQHPAQSGNSNVPRALRCTTVMECRAAR